MLKPEPKPMEPTLVAQCDGPECRGFSDTVNNQKLPAQVVFFIDGIEEAKIRECLWALGWRTIGSRDFCPKCVSMIS